MLPQVHLGHAGIFLIQHRVHQVLAVDVQHPVLSKLAHLPHGHAVVLTHLQKLVAADAQKSGQLPQPVYIGLAAAGLIAGVGGGVNAQLLRHKALGVPGGNAGFSQGLWKTHRSSLLCP